MGQYEDPNNAGTCIDDPCDPDPCNGNGDCDNSSGVYDCSCKTGYSDADDCAKCDVGYYEYPTGTLSGVR